jgi:hypothetical protein
MQELIRYFNVKPSKEQCDQRNCIVVDYKDKQLSAMIIRRSSGLTKLKTFFENKKLSLYRECGSGL